MIGLIGGIVAAGAAAAKGIAGAVQGAKQKRLAEEQAEAVAQQQANYGKYYDQRFRGMQDEAMGNQMAMAQSGGSAGAQGSNMRNAMSQSPLVTAAASRAADSYAQGRTAQENQTLGQQQALQRAGMQAQQQANMGLVDAFGQVATGAMNAAVVGEQQDVANERYDEWKERQVVLNDQADKRFKWEQQTYTAKAARDKAAANANQVQRAQALAEKQAAEQRARANAPLNQEDSQYVQDWSDGRTLDNQYQQMVQNVSGSNPSRRR